MDLQPDNAEAKKRINELTTPIYTNLRGNKFFTSLSLTEISFWDGPNQRQVSFPLSSVDRINAQGLTIDVFLKDNRKYFIDLPGVEKFEFVKQFCKKVFF